MPDPADQIRNAIERGEYGRAGTLWQEWSGSMAPRISAGTLDPKEWARASELYRWSRNLLIAERTHLLASLNTVHAAAAYGPPATASSCFVQGSF
jgi:hypothetical protein